VHCAGKVLLKKALRKGFNGCIHSTFAHFVSCTTGYQSCNAASLKTIKGTGSGKLGRKGADGWRSCERPRR